MVHLTEIEAVCPGDLMMTLGLGKFDEYRAEFKCLLSDNPDFLIEDWSTEPELLEVFYCWVRCMRPHTIVEIGTYKGRGAFVLASAQKMNDYGELYTIDDNRGGTVPGAKSRLENLGRAEKIRVLESNSQAAFAEWIRAKIDFLYIDGSHTYLDAAADFCLWSRHIEKERGLIVMHDTMFRLERRFPSDYVYPDVYYDVLHVKDMAIRQSGHEWKGAGFVTVGHDFRTGGSTRPLHNPGNHLTPER